MILKPKRHQSKKLRDSARGQECQIRIPEYCNGDPETTVLCHRNGGGMGTKKSDLHAAFGCSSCHAVVDGAVKTKLSPFQIDVYHRDAIERTQDYWLDVGLIKLP